ncbi:MAG: ABC transporter permease [Chlamydiae bacterium]|jgi:spermidine/putrescine transport system permease protein|nr:ABC transporter permease [Chlamydiota bacterium]
MEQVVAENIQVKNQPSFWNKLKAQLPFAVGIPAIIWQVVFFYVPLLTIGIYSFLEVNEAGKIVGFTINNFFSMAKWSYFNTIFQSIGLALMTSILCMVIGFPLSYFIAFRGGKYKTVFLFLLLVPFWTNFLLHIYAWFFVLEKEGFLNTLLLNLHIIQQPIHFLNSYFAVVLMMVYYYLPFMALPIYSALERFDHSLLEASLDLGASKWQTYKKILIPLVLSSIRGGVFLVYIPAFGEFVIPELMGGDKKYYVGSVVSQFILGENTAQLGTAFTVLSIIILLLTVGVIHQLFHFTQRQLTRGIQ